MLLGCSGPLAMEPIARSEVLAARPRRLAGNAVVDVGGLLLALGASTGSPRL